MKKLIPLLIVCALMGCSKSNPVAPNPPILGTMEMNNAGCTATTYSYSGERHLRIEPFFYIIHHNPGYISADSCKIWLYLDNGKMFYFPTTIRTYIHTANDNDLYCYDRCADTRLLGYPISVSDSLARPDSIVARITYNNSSGPKSQKFIIAPTDTNYSFTFTSNP